MAANSAAVVAKQKVLIKSISSEVIAAIEPLLKETAAGTSAELASIEVTLNGIAARLEIIENNNTGVAKRAVRGTQKTGGNVSGKTATPTDDPRDKVKNAMLYSRYAWAYIEAFRKEWRTEKAIAEIEKDPKISGLAADSTERLLAEGSFTWRKVMTAEERDRVRDEFARWKKQREIDNMPEALETDEVTE